ncbi:MAG: phosphomannomutase/phosphoglucomutase, partial [Kiritimatiellae bacterium]|nr:phosphomannomutase/phosphoglucomutase [Kiritimatiellia bacterium]
TTSDAVRDALVAGLADSGAEVSDLGRCTTPMVYFFTASDGFDGSVMVTASHNPPTDNGLKVSKKTALPVGYANGLGEVEKAVAASRLSAPRGGSAAAARPVDSAVGRYVAWQRAATDDAPFSDLRYAVDCSCGMASILVRDLFPGAVVLNDVPDGRFPCHSPNPLKSEARAQISRAVREGKLDCGIVFDGDADRAMFVDGNGEFVQPDYLIPALAEATRRAHPELGSKVVHDVRTSRGAVEALHEAGFETVMVPVGHAFAKPVMRSEGALCGGELAGHYYFGEFFGCDSGVLAARRILSEFARAKARGATFADMVRPVISRYANSGEINFRVEDKDAAIARALAEAREFGRETGRSEMDGVRLEFADGWISIRKSNTEPYLRLLAECRDRSMLKEWVRRLTSAIGW